VTDDIFVVILFGAHNESQKLHTMSCVYMFVVRCHWIIKHDCHNGLSKGIIMGSLCVRRHHVMYVSLSR